MKGPLGRLQAAIQQTCWWLLTAAPKETINSGYPPLSRPAHSNRYWIPHVSWRFPEIFDGFAWLHQESSHHFGAPGRLWDPLGRGPMPLQVSGQIHGKFMKNYVCWQNIRFQWVWRKLSLNQPMFFPLTMNMKMELRGKIIGISFFQTLEVSPRRRDVLSVFLNFKQILGKTKTCGFKNVYLGIYVNSYHITLHCIASNQWQYGKLP